MILFAYGVVGLLFGMLVKEQPASLRLMCFGVVTALAVHYLFQWAFWRGANPIAHMYAPDFTDSVKPISCLASSWCGTSG